MTSLLRYPELLGFLPPFAKGGRGDFAPAPGSPNPSFPPLLQRGDALIGFRGPMKRVAQGAHPATLSLACGRAAPPPRHPGTAGVALVPCPERLAASVDTRGPGTRVAWRTGSLVCGGPVDSSERPTCPPCGLLPTTGGLSCSQGPRPAWPVSRRRRPGRPWLCPTSDGPICSTRPEAAAPAPASARSTVDFLGRAPPAAAAA